MSCRERLIELFETERIPYRMHAHPPTYTAQEEAGTEHLPGRRVAKVVIAFAGHKPVMLVLGADRRVHVGALWQMVGWEHVRLASEDEMEGLFPDCEVGAMPALGNLYGLPVYLDTDLAKEQEITFLAGSHTESVTIPTAAFEQVARSFKLPLAAPSGQGGADRDGTTTPARRGGSQMLVSDIMTQPAKTVRASATVAEAAELMALHDVGSLPARDEDKIVGIVTDRDVVLRCIAAGLDPGATLVRTIMTRSPVTVPPSTPVDDALWLFAHLRIRRLPIVEAGQVVGMLSADDVARYFDDEASIVLMARCLAPRRRTRAPKKAAAATAA